MSTEHTNNADTNTADEYAPSTTGWVRKHVDEIDAAGDTNVAKVMGRRTVMLTMRGVKSGKIRKVPLMRVEHEGRYAAVASQGGAPENPKWYSNLLANPDIELQDGTTSTPMRARELHDQERYEWWVRSVAAYPPYAEYQVKTQRQIPVFVLEPR